MPERRSLLYNGSVVHGFAVTNVPEPELLRADNAGVNVSFNDVGCASPTRITEVSPVKRQNMALHNTVAPTLAGVAMLSLALPRADLRADPAEDRGDAAIARGDWAARASRSASTFICTHAGHKTQNIGTN